MREDETAAGGPEVAARKLCSPMVAVAERHLYIVDPNGETGYMTQSSQATTVAQSRYFDFLRGFDYPDYHIDRLNWRYAHIVEPLKAEIAGTRILDLGSHDGRWPLAYADAGAKEVVGLEGRASLVEKFRTIPGNNKNRVDMRVGDFVVEMDKLIEAGETFDIVSCLGVYYHTTHHYKIMCQMAAFRPKLIILDSEFLRTEEPVIRITKENPESDLNTIQQFPGQNRTPIGIASLAALRVMVSSVGYSIHEVEWAVPEEERTSVGDYYDKFENRRRATLLLRPKR